jgi:hypothetical protein
MNSSGTVANGIGQPVRRKEDFCLLTGRDSFADNVHPPIGACGVRAAHAHAPMHVGTVHILMYFSSELTPCRARPCHAAPYLWLWVDRSAVAS